MVAYRRGQPFFFGGFWNLQNFILSFSMDSIFYGQHADAALGIVAVLAYAALKADSLPRKIVHTRKGLRVMHHSLP